MKKSFALLLTLVCLFTIGVAATAGTTQAALTFTNADQILFVGKTTVLKPKLDNIKEKASYGYTSSDEGVATISGKGTVKAVAPGTTTITCAATVSAGTYEASYILTVLQPVKGITLVKPLTMAVGTTYALDAGIKPADATIKTLKWSSSKESVVTADENGILAAHAKGSATITAAATDGSKKKATITVTVKEFDAVIFSKQGATVSYTTGNGMFGINYTAKNDRIDYSSGDGDTVILTPLEPGVDTFTISVTNYLTRGTKRYPFSVYIAPDALIFEDDAAAMAMERTRFLAAMATMYELAYEKKGPEYSIFLLIDEDAKIVRNFSSHDMGVLVGTYKGDFSKEANVHYKGGDMHNFLRFGAEDDNSTLMLKDMDGFEYEYIRTEVSEAIEVLNQDGYKDITIY